MRRRKSDLEVKATRISVHVQDLSRKIQALTVLGCHTARVYLLDGYAALGDNGFFNGAVGNRLKGQPSDDVQQGFPLILGALFRNGYYSYR